MQSPVAWAAGLYGRWLNPDGLNSANSKTRRPRFVVEPEPARIWDDGALLRDDVGAALPVELIRAWASDQRVVSVAAEDRVVAGVADQLVGEGVADQAIVAVAADKILHIGVDVV